MLAWIGSPLKLVSQILFLDRDGVLNVDSPNYVKSWGEFVLYSDVLKALRRFRRLQLPVVIISNQSGLNRGLIRWPDFWFMHQQMVRVIREAGGDLLAAFYCPHRPDESCGCRKPSPSLLLAATQLFQVPPESTVFVGDRITDIQAAVAAGSKPVLLERSPLGEPAWSDFGISDPPMRIKSLQEVESLFVGSSSMV